MKILPLIFVLLVIEFVELKSTKSKAAEDVHGYSNLRSQYRAQGVRSVPLTYNPTSYGSRGKGKGGSNRQSALATLLELKRAIISRFTRIFSRPLESSYGSFGYYNRPDVHPYHNNPYVSYGQPSIVPVRDSPPLRLLPDEPRKKTEKVTPHKVTPHKVKQQIVDSPYKAPSYVPIEEGIPIPAYDPHFHANYIKDYKNTIPRPAYPTLPLADSLRSGLDAESLARGEINSGEVYREMEELADYIMLTDSDPEMEFRLLNSEEEVMQLNEDIDKAIEYLMRDEIDVENMEEPWPMEDEESKDQTTQADDINTVFTTEKTTTPEVGQSSQS